MAKRIKVIVEVCRRYEVIVETDLESAAEAQVANMSVEHIESIGSKVPTKPVNSSVDVIDATVMKD